MMLDAKRRPCQRRAAGVALDIGTGFRRPFHIGGGRARWNQPVIAGAVLLWLPGSCRLELDLYAVF